MISPGGQTGLLTHRVDDPRGGGGAAQVEAPALEDLRLVVMVELHLPAVNTIHHQRIIIINIKVTKYNLGLNNNVPSHGTEVNEIPRSIRENLAEMISSSIHKIPT